MECCSLPFRRAEPDWGGWSSPTLAATLTFQEGSARRPLRSTASVLSHPYIPNHMFGPSFVYGSPLMRTWTEGLLAIGVVLALGFAFLLFTGESLTDGTPTTTPPVISDPESAARGELIANGTGCLACHTTDGTPGSGPTWKGLAGSSRPLTSNEVVIADDDYLRRAIVDPSVEVVQGFDPIMPPDYGDQLTDQEITDLVEYIKSLSA
jgi:mono/diheme cytochrome c family protein